MSDQTIDPCSRLHMKLNENLPFVRCGVCGVQSATPALPAANGCVPMTTFPEDGHLLGLQEPAPGAKSKLKLMQEKVANIQRRQQADAKRKREREAELEAQAAQLQVSDDSQDLLGEETAQAVTGGLQELTTGDEEPPCYDMSVFSTEAPTSVQQPAVDLQFLLDSGLALEAGECSTAWHTLLAHRSVVACCGAHAAVLKALYRAACSAESLEASAACAELCSRYEAEAAAGDNGPHTGQQPGTSSRGSASTPATLCELWVPSLSEVLQQLKVLGYVAAPSDGSPTGALPPGAASSSSSRPSAAPQEQPPVPQRSVLHLKHLLQVIMQSCSLLAARTIPGWDFQQHQAEAKDLLLGIYRLRLHPLLQSALLPDLLSAQEQLSQAWSRASKASWEAALPDLAQQLSAVGPGHRAALRVSVARMASVPATLRLSEQAALALVSRLLDRKASESTAQLSCVDQLKQLLGPGSEAQKLLAALQEPSQGTGQEGALDCWKVRTVLQAADAVMWPMQAAGSLSDAEWSWWSTFLRCVEERLGKSRTAAGVRRLLSAIRNNYEFMRS